MLDAASNEQLIVGASEYETEVFFRLCLDLLSAASDYQKRGGGYKKY
jgi:hypothetical protein